MKREIFGFGILIALIIFAGVTVKRESDRSANNVELNKKTDSVTSLKKAAYCARECGDDSTYNRLYDSFQPLFKRYDDLYGRVYPDDTTHGNDEHYHCPCGTYAFYGYYLDSNSVRHKFTSRDTTFNWPNQRGITWVDSSGNVRGMTVMDSTGKIWNWGGIKLVDSNGRMHDFTIVDTTGHTDNF